MVWRTWLGSESLTLNTSEAIGRLFSLRKNLISCPESGLDCSLDRTAGGVVTTDVDRVLLDDWCVVPWRINGQRTPDVIGS